jgi:hypothetical protein
MQQAPKSSDLQQTVPLRPATQPSPSTSGIGTHTVNGRFVNGHDPAENVASVDSNMASGHQAEGSTLNN